MDSIAVKDKGFFSLVLFWFGLVSYNIGYLAEEYTQSFNVPLFKLLIVIGILIPFMVVFSRLKLTLEGYGRQVWVLYFLTFFWCVVMLLRSDLSELANKQNYLNPYTLIPYLCMLSFFMPLSGWLQSFVFVSKRLNWLFFILFLIPVVSKVNYGFIQFLMETFVVGAAFLFITNRYHSTRTILVSFVVLLLAFLVATLTARRNLMLTFALYLMIGSVLALLNGKIKSMESKFILVAAGILALIGSVAFYLEESTGTFSNITTRAGENTREEVFVSFILDMANPTDLSLGRGIFGEYYCPGVDRDSASGETNDYRRDIECGYLQLVLKGGVVYLLLYLSLIGMGIWKGLRSSNQLCKGCAWILLVQLVDMIGFGLHGYNVKTFMIWMALAICLSDAFLRKTDAGIESLLYQKKYKLLPWEKK